MNLNYLINQSILNTYNIVEKLFIIIIIFLVLIYVFIMIKFFKKK